MDVLVGEVQLAHEARVSLPQHGVTISWNNLARLEGLVDELVDAFSGPIVTVLFLEGKEEVEALDDFEVGDEDLMPKQKARIHNIPGSICDRNVILSIPPKNLNVPGMALHQGDMTVNETKFLNLVEDIVVH